MPQGTSPLDVRRVAALARLTLTDDEEARFARQLQAVLDYAAQVTAIDTADVPPTTHVLAPRHRERPDAPQASLTMDETLRNAPDAPAGVFRVPRVVG